MQHCEPVANCIYRIEVPLPDNPLRALNSYVITSGERPLLVDVGFNRVECVDALAAGLRDLGYGFENVDVLITHSHPDHCGAIDAVYRPGATVYAGFPDFLTIASGYHTHVRGFRAWMSGGCEVLPEGEDAPRLSAEELCVVQDRSADYADMGDIVIPLAAAPITVLADGDVLHLGDRHLQVIKVQGHDPYHLCLFDPADGVLIAGDQVLERITPNLASFALGEDLLGKYLASLDRLEPLPVRQVLTGHRALYTDLAGRVAQLRVHHAERSQEVLAAIGAGKCTLLDVARTITWRNPIPVWDDWPEKQKYFAIGETLVHLTYLEGQGKVTHTEENGTVVFGLRNSQ